MVDLPDRSAYGAHDRAEPDEEQGWGSPVPAEYGSLRAMPAFAGSPAPLDEPPEAPPEPPHPSASEPGERWAVTSLLRRLQGDSAGAAPAFAGAPAPEPVPAAEPIPAERPPEPETASAPIWLPDDLPADAGIDPAELGPELAGPLAGPPPEVILGNRHRRRMRRAPLVRSRATVRHVDLGSVARVSVIFWAVILVALIVASFLLWLFADAFGSLPSIEKSVRTLFSLKSFKLHPGTVAVYTAAGGVVLAVAGILANLILAMIYNLIADVVGGIRVELESRSPE